MRRIGLLLLTGLALSSAVAAANPNGAVGLSVDRATVLEIFRKACAEGSAKGCYSLGLMVEHGKGEPSTGPAKAAGYYQKACAGGWAEGCTNLGSLYKRGKGGVPVDLAKAAELYDKACKMGNQAGCEQLGKLVLSRAPTAKE